MFDTIGELSNMQEMETYAIANKNLHNLRHKNSNKSNILNFRLLDRILQNKKYVELVNDWIIWLVNSILEKDFLETVIEPFEEDNLVSCNEDVSVNTGLSLFSNDPTSHGVHEDDEIELNYRLVKYMNVDIDDAKLKNFIGADLSTVTPQMSALKNIIACFDYKNIEYFGIETRTNLADIAIDLNTWKRASTSTHARSSTASSSATLTPYNLLHNDSILAENASTDLFSTCKARSQLYVFEFLECYCKLKLKNKERMEELVNYKTQRKSAMKNSKAYAQALETLKKNPLQAYESSRFNTNVKALPSEENESKMHIAKTDFQEEEKTHSRGVSDNYGNQNEQNTGNYNHLDSSNELDDEKGLENDESDYESEQNVSKGANIDALSHRSQLQPQDNKILERERDVVGVFWIERFYAFVVEILSTADLITDLIIVQQLYRDATDSSEKYATDSRLQWLTIGTIVFMIAPYLVSYSVLGSVGLYFIQNRETMQTMLSADSNGNKCNKFENGLYNIAFLTMMTPLNVIYFMLIDLFFMIYTIITFITFIVTGCDPEYDLKHWIDDNVFKAVLRMNRMQIIGVCVLYFLFAVCSFFICLLLVSELVVSFL